MPYRDAKGRHSTFLSGRLMPSRVPRERWKWLLQPACPGHPGLETPLPASHAKSLCSIRLSTKLSMSAAKSLAALCGLSKGGPASLEQTRSLETHLQAQPNPGSPARGAVRAWHDLDPGQGVGGVGGSHPLQLHLSNVAIKQPCSKQILVLGEPLHTCSELPSCTGKTFVS